MTAGRVIEAGLQLLDRQLVDQEGRMCGNVDDLELTPDEETGQLYVTAILAGPGVLASRIGTGRIGSWLRWAHQRVMGAEDDPARIPMHRVRDIGAVVKLNASREELGTFDTERWVADHVIRHIPGSHHEAE
ncbi:MAG: hypothetical protein LC792_03880 [Actinobacteria bacterium]|nr:hypothetical protein [Actinomycetota bacterium]